MQTHCSLHLDRWREYLVALEPSMVQHARGREPTHLASSKVSGMVASRRTRLQTASARARLYLASLRERAC